MDRRQGETATTNNNETVTKDSLVGPLIDRYPQALEVFVRHGFVMLQDENMRRDMAETVTIDRACNIHHADREKLVAELNQVCLGSRVQG